MRGRLGGIIGVASQPSAGSASRIWSLAEVYSAKRGAYGTGLWPTKSFTIAWQGSVDTADATFAGEATFNAEVRSSSAGDSFDYVWERSTDAGATWATVAGSAGTATTDYDYSSYAGGGISTLSLTRTGQTIANDENLYRLVVTAGLKTFVGPPATLRFDTVTISVADDLFIWGENDTKLQERTVEASWPWGIYFAWVASPVGQKYNASYPFTLVQNQVSNDGGTTWTTFSTQENFVGAGGWNFMQTTADNGKKYRVILTYKTVTFTSRVVTLYVT